MMSPSDPSRTTRKRGSGNAAPCARNREKSRVDVLGVADNRYAYPSREDCNARDGVGGVIRSLGMNIWT